MITFIETDPRVLLDTLISRYEDVAGETLYPGDERFIFLQNFAQVLIGIENDINDTANQNFLRNARGETLDGMGEMFNVTRLQPKKAAATFLITLTAAQDFNVTVPKGTRITPDGYVFFATTEEVVFTPTQTTKSVQGEAGDFGQEHNGFVAGQIKILVDSNPFILSVVNTVTSTGGSGLESDDEFRMRIYLAPESMSIAGPEAAYVFWAKSASDSISDVSVTSPTPGTVKISILLNDGIVPESDDPILALVAEACNAHTRRPLTDLVIVEPTEAVSYNISFTYYVNALDVANASAVQANVSSAVGNYIDWQRAKLGRSISPDELRRLVLNAGASRVTLTAPVYATIAEYEVAQIGTTSVTYGGLE